MCFGFPLGDMWSLARLFLDQTRPMLTSYEKPTKILYIPTLSTYWGNTVKVDRRKRKREKDEKEYKKYHKKVYGKLKNGDTVSTLTKRFEIDIKTTRKHLRILEEEGKVFRIGGFLDKQLLENQIEKRVGGKYYKINPVLLKEDKTLLELVTLRVQIDFLGLLMVYLGNKEMQEKLLKLETDYPELDAYSNNLLTVHIALKTEGNLPIMLKEIAKLQEELREQEKKLSGSSENFA